jgi:hypothetical protein
MREALDLDLDGWLAGVALHAGSVSSAKYFAEITEPA